MKKVILSIIMIIVILNETLCFALNNTSGSAHSSTIFEQEVIGEEANNEKIPAKVNEDDKDETSATENEDDNQETPVAKKEDNNEKTPATEKILDNMSQKDKKIAEYTDKYNNATYAYTAYCLDMVQLYSIPVCIIGITIGAFNYYIIGEKKLDKKEQGFGLIMAFLCGLVLFQVLPLIFALLVAGK